MSGLKKTGLQGDLIAAFQLTMGTCKKGREKISTGAYSDRTKDSGFKLKEKALTGHKEEIFYCEDDEVLAQDVQRCSRCPTICSSDEILSNLF